jgi:hypothetical protein
MKNWKTTVAGIMAFVAVVLAQASAALDGDPATVANWQAVIPAAVICWGLVKAADSK